MIRRGSDQERWEGVTEGRKREKASGLSPGSTHQHDLWRKQEILNDLKS